MEYLKPHEAAKVLNVSESTINRWEREGTLKALRTPKGHRVFRREDVEKLLPREAVLQRGTAG